MKDVVVVGSVSMDTIVQADSSRIKMGGVAVYGAITFRRFGLRTTVVTNIGPEKGVFLELFQQQGIEIYNGVSESTTTCIDRVNDDDRRSEFVAFAEPISADQVLRRIVGTKHVHLGPLHPLDIDPTTVLGLLRERRIPVSIDLQGYVRSSQTGPTALLVSEHLSAAMNAASIVKANNAELQAILRATGMDVKDLMRVHRINEFVITAGREGGKIVLDSGDEVRYEAIPAGKEIDPTGAGDVFFASYIASRLYHELSVSESCHRAALVAGMQVGGQYILDEQIAF